MKKDINQQIQVLKAELEVEKALRKKREKDLQDYQKYLEELVTIRTNELEKEIEQRKKIEQELVNNEATLQRTITELELLHNILPSALFTVDKNRIITSWNNKITEITGYSAEEAIGKPCTLFTVEPCCYNCGLFSKKVKKPISNNECTIRDKSGKIHTIIKSADLLCDDDGKVIGGVETFEDITNRLMIENKVKKGQQRYKYLFDASPISIWEEDFSEAYNYIQDQKKKGITDFRKHFSENMDNVVLCSKKIKILDINMATLKMFGTESKEDLLVNLSRIFTEDSLNSFADQMICIAEGKKEFEGECVNKTFDGRILNVVLRWTTVDGYEHNYSRVLVSIIDITATKEIEHARIASEKKYRKMFELSPESIIMIDNKGVINDINPRVTDWLGYKTEEIKGKSIMELPFIDRKNKVKMVKQFRNQQKGITVAPYELEFTTETGEKKIGRILGTATKLEDGEFTNNLLMIMDVTKSVEAKKALEKAMQEAKAAAKAKANFLASMSHEIRTPMNGVIGMTSLLADTDLTDEQKEFVDTIRLSGDSLLTIINDILDFSKIESAKMELEEQPFNLRSCIEEAFDLVATKAAEKDLDLLYLIESEVPAAIYGDITRLRQILVNLVNNAIKFTETGEVFITVSLKSNHRKNIELQFSVKDTGIGIPEDRLDKLFKAFSQVDSSTTRKYGGTGLGLAISQKLCRLMGGDIWVESKFGEGSVFYFTIQSTIAPTKHKTNYVKSLIELQGKRVLLVDDNLTNLRILSLQCEKWGLQTKSVTSGKSALTSLQDDDAYDLAIIDMQMPNMDGVELGMEIRKLYSPKELPMIMLSSQGKSKNLAETDLFDICLTKPTKQSSLFESLLTVVGKEERKKIKQKKPNDSLNNIAKTLPLKILIAEDNAINQKLALKIFQKMGYNADIAGNGLEVLDALKRQNYDIIYMDVQMPEMDGLEATEKIKQKWGDKSPIIIAMTANALDGDKENCLAAGMDDYISKPIRLNEIQESVIRWGSKKDSSAKNEKREDLSEADLIDWKIIDSILDLDEASEKGKLLKEIYEMYCQSFDNNIDSIRKAIMDNNFEMLTSEAHKMKGASANLGISAIAEICHKLEKKGHSKIDSGINELIDQIPDLYKATQEKFENYFSNLNYRTQGE